MKSEFFHIYKQTHYGIAIPVVKDEMEIELPVTINEQIFTEISDPIADQQHPAKKFGDLIYYDKSEPPPPPPQQSTSTIIKEKEKKVEPEKNYEERMEGDKTVFSCKICETICSSVKIMNLHLKRHFVHEKNFVCQHCGHAFRYQCSLNKHLARHEDGSFNALKIW